MAFELFAGTLDRYYSDVETAEEAARTHEIVCHWRDSIVKAVKKAAPEAAPWAESMDRDYRVAQLEPLHWGALQLVAASGVYGKPCRETVYPGWNWEDEPVVQTARADRSLNMSLLKGATWWLPVQTPILMGGQLPSGDRAVISSGGALLLELLRINELVWKADQEEVLSWLGVEGKIPADAKRLDTQSLAKYAYSAFWQLATFAMETGVPVIFDRGE